jgi:hypothetical protein
MNEFKYYMLRRSGDQAYPLLRIAGKDYDENGRASKVYLEINTPRPRKPVLADYLYSAASSTVSKRIAEAMQQLGMEGVQFIPTELTLPKGEIIEDYICVKVDDNTYEAMDKEKSDFTKGSGTYSSYFISKVVLDRKVLSEIPLSKRLGFRLKELPATCLYHESVIEAIAALNPTGVYFQDIEEHEF